MRMQIYEHIYDLSPPIFTHKMVNNLYFSHPFRASRKSRENLFKKIWKLNPFCSHSPFVPQMLWRSLWNSLSTEIFLNRSRTQSRWKEESFALLSKSAYKMLSCLKLNEIYCLFTATRPELNFHQPANAIDDKTFDKLAQRRDNLRRD